MKRCGFALWNVVMVLMLLAGCGGGGGSTAPGDTTTDTTAPSTPAGLVATAASSSSIALSWTASTDNVGVTGYRIYRGGTQISTSAINAFNDSGLTSSTTYTYTVSAYDAAGNTSAQSTLASATTLATGVTDTTAPTVPANLTATTISATQVNLSWTASTDAVGVTEYKIYRGGAYLKSASAISSSDTGLTASTQYCYQVTAYDAAGNESAKSTQSCATTTAAVGPGANFRMPDTNQTTSYTATFGEDHDYIINPPSYTDNGNGTITDNVTTLVWQKQDDGVRRTWADAITYCDTLTLGGQTDWRLPSLIELISIIDNGVYTGEHIRSSCLFKPIYFRQQRCT